MFKLSVFIALFALVSSAYAKPAVFAAAPVVAAAPAGVVTATSSQYIARNYNGVAGVYAAPFTAAYSAPVVAAPVSSAYTAPLAAAPYTYPFAAAAYTSVF